MTKDEIRAELRRSACEDCFPWRGVDDDAHEAALGFLHAEELAWHLWIDCSVARNFFLFVAEAL